jgi:hypothetical protein
MVQSAPWTGSLKEFRMTFDRAQHEAEMHKGYGRNGTGRGDEARRAAAAASAIRSELPARIQSWPAAGGGLLVCVVSNILAGSADGLPRSQPSAFLRVGSDHRVRLDMPHVRLPALTANRLASAVADELGVHPGCLEVESAASDDDPFGIAGKPMLDDVDQRNAAEHELQVAAAVARSLLVAAAADTWRVSETACRVWQGCVTCVDSDRYMRYGSLSVDAALIELPAEVTLRGGRRVEIDPLPQGSFRYPRRQGTSGI